MKKLNVFAKIWNKKKTHMWKRIGTNRCKQNYRRGDREPACDSLSALPFSADCGNLFVSSYSDIFPGVAVSWPGGFFFRSPFCGKSSAKTDSKRSLESTKVDQAVLTFLFDVIIWDHRLTHQRKPQQQRVHGAVVRQRRTSWPRPSSCNSVSCNCHRIPRSYWSPAVSKSY